MNSITLVATDLAGNFASKTILVTLDSTPPVVTITAPISGSITKSAQVTVTGTISKANTTATINGTPVAVTNQAFSFTYNLNEGDNTLTVEATDRAGNKGSGAVTVALDTQLPVLSLQAPFEAAAGANVAITVNASDNNRLTLVELKADGVPIWSGGNGPSVAEAVSYRLSPSLNAGSEVVFQAKGIDAAGNEGTANATIRITQAAAGPGYIQGKVLDDLRGLRLEGAMVAITDGKGETSTLSTASDGGYFLEVPSGNAFVKISKPGYTTVERVVPVMPEKKATALDARLTKVSDKENIIAVDGGTASVELTSASPFIPHNSPFIIELTIPAGTLSVPADIRLTPVSNQGLASALPLGWSPLAAADLRLLDPIAGTAVESSLTSAATLKLPIPQAVQLAPDAVVTLAEYDAASRQWKAKGSATLAADGLSATADIQSAGQYALLLPDPDSGAPPAAETGKPVPAAVAAPLAYDAVTAQGKVVPQASPPSTGLKAAGEVVLTAKEGASPTFTSGLVLNSRITESFDLKSGDKAESPAYAQDIILYRYPCVTNIGAGALGGAVSGPVLSGAEVVELRTTFPVSPSKDYTIVELLLGKVGLEITIPDTTESGVMVGADGGRLADADGNILVIPQGSLAQTTPVSTRNGAAAPGAVGDDFTLIKVVDVNLTRQTLAQAATLSIQAPAGVDPNLPLILARQIDVKGVAKLKLVAPAKQSGSLISSDTALAGITMPGITTSGTYYFLQAKGQIGFVGGTVTDASNNAYTGAFVNTDKGSLVDLAASTGKYLLALPVAPFTATATDLYKNDQVSGNGVVTAANQAVTLHLKIVMIPPTVVSVTPNGVNVQPNVPVVITFSKSIDQNSITFATLKVTDSDGGTVAGVFTFSVDGKVVTFSPAELLKSEKSYTVTLSGNIKDLQGYFLGNDAVSTFTVRKTTPPPMPAAGAVSATFPDSDGYVTVTGTQGSAEPNDTVLIINDTSGEIVSVTPASNGSFTGKVRAQLGDEIKVVLMDHSGNQTLISYITYKSDDGKYLVTAKGGKIEGEGGSVLEIPEGALYGPTVIKLSLITEADLPHPVQEGASFVAGVNIDTGGIPFQKEVQFSVPLPAGYQNEKTPFVATPDTLVNADGTEEKVFVIVDSAKVVDGRLSTACAPFDGVMTFGFFAFFQFPALYPAIVSGYTYRDMDGDGTFSTEDLPVKNAVIRAPASWNYVSYSNSSGFYATFSEVMANIGGDCKDYAVTAINPQTMYRKTINSSACEPPYNIKRLNFKLADKESIFPDKTPPLISMNLQVAPGQPPEAKFTAGTIPVGTDIQVPLSVIDQGMGTVTLTVQAPGAKFPKSVQVNQVDFVIHTVLSADKPAIFRYTYAPSFTAPVVGSDPAYFCPALPGVYAFSIEAKDAAGNISRVTRLIRAVEVGSTPGGIDGAPTIDMVSPANDATDVMVTAPVTVYFSEPVDNVTDATFKLIDTVTGLAVPATVLPSIEGGRMTAVLTPKGNLYYDREYKIVLTQGITDSNTNPSYGDKLLPLKDAFQATFRTKVPRAYDLPPDEQSAGGWDIALYNDQEGNRSYAYLTAMDKGWKAVDVTDPTNPFITYAQPPLNQVNFRYVAVEPQQKILGMTESLFNMKYGYVRFYDLAANPEAPLKIGQEKLAEEYSGVPSRLALSGKYAYVSTIMAGLQVVDIDIAKENVSTGRMSSGLAIVGVFDPINTGYGQPGDIAVYGNGKGLLTTSYGYLLTLDLSTPESPQLMNPFRPADYKASRVAVAAEYAYTDADSSTRTMDLAVTGSPMGKINTVDVTDPYNPKVIGTAKNESGADVLAYANEITMSKDAGMAFVTTYNSIQVFDVKDPYHPRLLNEIMQLPDESGTMTPIGSIPAIVEKGGWVYMASQAKGMRVMDLDPVLIVPDKANIFVLLDENNKATKDYSLKYTVNVEPGNSATFSNQRIKIYKDGAVINTIQPAPPETSIKLIAATTNFDINSEYYAEIVIYNDSTHEDIPSRRIPIVIGQFSLSDLEEQNINLVGAVTDGTSELVLRLKVSPNYQGIKPVFSLRDPQLGVNGTFTGVILLNGQEVTSAIIPINPGTRTAKAIYRAPAKFARFGADATIPERNVLLDIGVTDIIQNIKLRRPPVLLVHGLWAEAADWKYFKAIFNENKQFDVYSTEYKSNNAGSFASNKVADDIGKRLEKMVEAGFADSKINYIGHSMGGLLLKEHCITYGSCANNINKYVTIDTPHTGSELANVMIDVNATKEASCMEALEFVASVGKRVWEDPQKTKITGGIIDLAVGSQALQRQQGPVAVLSG